ncbi:hypothetical protein EST38_g11571 [Candolleomyces aberdarensis]|uniref:glucan 1,3-beta-glucosidase n=1 Tax=Candolleomyces aberdarensis TaxID=2316362 RepID=A0A4Q2D609_9AGAR|nr:hypothetical protein EST38_g11571 [Candolleomyces aberdarensis]
MIINDVKEPVQGPPSQPLLTPRPPENSSEVDLPPPPYQVNGHNVSNSAPSLLTQSASIPNSTTLNSGHHESSNDSNLSPKDVGIPACTILLPVYFKVIRRRETEVITSESEVITSGGNGSHIVMEDGTEFVYSNPFGGFWVYDSNDPFNSSAQPNAWTPPLNIPWDFTTHRIHGVNLGGLFLLELITSPALFQKYPGTMDEWDLSVAMANDTSSGGLGQIEEHYRTFITEKDIADIAGAGLTWIRLPIGFWAIETWPGEPFLEHTSWNSLTGGTTGGKWGQIEFLNGVMGIANAQRTLYYIRVLAEFISRSEWKNVVPMLSIVNSPAYRGIGVDQVRSFYNEAYRVVREATGYGTGNGPYLVMFDGGDSSSAIFRNDFMSGADRVILERQPCVVTLSHMSLGTAL